jgi:hypothetical protein
MRSQHILFERRDNYTPRFLTCQSLWPTIVAFGTLKGIGPGPVGLFSKCAAPTRFRLLGLALPGARLVLQWCIIYSRLLHVFNRLVLLFIASRARFGVHSSIPVESLHRRAWVAEKSCRGCHHRPSPTMLVSRRLPMANVCPVGAMLLSTRRACRPCHRVRCLQHVSGGFRARRGWLCQAAATPNPDMDGDALVQCTGSARKLGALDVEDDNRRADYPVMSHKHSLAVGSLATNCALQAVVRLVI